MKRMNIVGVLAVAVIALSGCVENSGSSGGAMMTGSSSINSLATRGNLSPDAIRLQTMSMTLMSLEEEQNAARKRVADFRAQGAVIGGVAGVALGALACNLSDCSDQQRNRAMLAGGVGGGAIGYQQGGAQAQRQNAAAQAENALKRRLQIADQQLTTARRARAQAERVAAANQNKLTSIKAQVAAGTASKASLDLARADAAADAKQIRQAVAVLDDSRASVKDESRLSSQGVALSKEEQATQRSYNALVSSIESSAL